VCVSVCLTINTLYIQRLEEIFPLPTKKTVEVSNQIIILNIYYIISRLITLLKITDAPIQVPNIFYLTASFKCLYFSFQIFLIFVSELSAIFMSYIVRII